MDCVSVHCALQNRHEQNNTSLARRINTSTRLAQEVVPKLSILRSMLHEYSEPKVPRSPTFCACSWL